MKLIKTLCCLFILTTFLSAKEEINIDFKDLKIMELVEITSKIIDKNILITHHIKGNVDFISNNKPLEKDEIVKILVYVLESKGFTLIENNNILRIVKLDEGVKNNTLIVNSHLKSHYYQMVTEVFPVHNANVDYIASKVKHLISKSAKLVTNKESNILVITDFKDNVNTIKRVVSLMTSKAKKTTALITLKNIKALESKKNLELIAKSKFNSQVQTDKITIIANKDDNSLLLIGKKLNIDYLKKYIENVDNNVSSRKNEVEVISLKNVEAKSVIKIIDEIIKKKKYINPEETPLSSIDDESNAIVLMGLSSQIKPIKKLIYELDKEKAQVYVQAKIIEVNDDLVNEVGVKYGILGGKVGSNGLGTFTSTLNGGSAIAFSPKDIGLEIPDITSGLALGATISLLNQDGALDIVSEPSILAINNKESSIYVGETISIKTSSTTTDGGNTSDSFKRENVGLTLKVKPRISNDNKVTLEINTILEDVKTTQTNSGNADTTKKEVNTSAIVKNGESVIIGGLIEDKEALFIRKVPLLGDVPIVGNLFTHNKTDLRKKSLLIIVTPYIVPKSKDLSFVRNELAQLKILEDKYLKESLIILKQKQINKIKKDIEYKDKIEKLDKEYSSLSNRKVTTFKKNDINQNVSTHEDRMKIILGNDF